jgi:hypothetical protein
LTREAGRKSRSSGRSKPGSRFDRVFGCSMYGRMMLSGALQDAAE